MAHLNKSDTPIKTISLFLLFIIIITLLQRTLNAGAVALIDASCIIVLEDHIWPIASTALTSQFRHLEIKVDHP